MRTSHMTRFLFTAAALAATSTLAAAQEAPRVITVDGNRIFQVQRGAVGGSIREMPVSDAVVRSLIEKYQPDVLEPGAERTGVILVLDQNNNYVSSKAAKAMVVSRTLGHSGDTVVVSGSPSANVVISLRDSLHLGELRNGAIHVGELPAEIMRLRNQAIAGGTTVTGERRFSLLTPNAAGVTVFSHSGGASDLGIEPEQISEISHKRYEAGALGAEALSVTVIRLKQ